VREIFDAVRARCVPAVWSRGVELTRAGSVVAVSESPDQIVVRVSTRGGLIAPTVTLYLDDGSWECTCGAAVCEHAAAAVISLRRAGEGAHELPRAGVESGRVGYRLTRAAGAVALERVVVVAGDERPITATLAAMASGRVDGPPFVAAPEDLAAELALGTHRRGPVPTPLWAALLPVLARCADVRLDAAPIRVAPDPVFPVARVEDQGDGFRLVVHDNPRITETFRNGVVLCGDTVRPQGETRLTGREMHELPGGKHFPEDAIAELVTEVLPSLARRIELEIATTRLPSTTSEVPRAVVDTVRDGHTLSVLATIVYGDPPCARVDAGRLVPLGEGPVPIRDPRAEQRIAREMEARLGLTPGARAAFDGEAAVAFAAKLDAWRGEVRGSGSTAFRRCAPLTPRVRIEGEIVDVVFESSGVGSSAGTARSSDVLRAWRDGASLIPLLEGGWAPLPLDWLSRYGHRVADLLAARDAGQRLPRAVLPDLADLCDDMGLEPPAGAREMQRFAADFAGVPSAALPADLTATLRPYQREGVDRLAFLRDAGLGAMLADDMGLGKTVQALCALRGRTLVVCPTSVLHNWADEIRRFRPGLRHAVYHGPRRALDPEADVTLTTYAILRSDEDALAAVAWDTAILDEAQAIKNPDSQVTRAAWRLEAGFKLTMTGTPVENRLEELWSQFHFINRGLLGPSQDFQERYVRPITGGEPGAAERLRRRIRPFVVRRLKRLVAPELPPRSDSVLYCSLEAEERQVYDAVRAASRPEILRRLQEGGGVLQALEALLRLRQAACHAGLVPGQTAATSSKVARLLEALDTVIADGHKALVFSQWTALLDLIEPHLRRAATRFVRLDGSTRDRGEVVARFQDEAGPPVMLVSLKAGGTGLNLTAADHVFLMDPWWNPAVEDQAADRAHRIGQVRPVLVYRLVAEETVEERILALQDSKRSLADAALGEAEVAAALTREDLLFLLD
jgi:superfamily II DNA or RNA helicase